MPQSLANIHIHLVFRTKDRFPFIKDEVRAELHSSMATVLANLGCPATIINSVEDHVHVLFRLSRTVAVAKVVEEVKKGSSKWLESKSPMLEKFAWQAGDGVFGVSESNVAQVVASIENQREHHRTKSCKEEDVAFLGMHRIEYDDRYLWD